MLGDIWGGRIYLNITWMRWGRGDFWKILTRKLAERAKINLLNVMKYPLVRLSGSRRPAWGHSWSQLHLRRGPSVFFNRVGKKLWVQYLRIRIEQKISNMGEGRPHNQAYEQERPSHFCEKEMYRSELVSRRGPLLEKKREERRRLNSLQSVGVKLQGQVFHSPHLIGIATWVTPTMKEL